jgi:hypothetical protein
MPLLVFAAALLLLALLLLLLLLLLLQVGIEECLHIEFEYDKARYHLKVSSSMRHSTTDAAAV